MAIAARAGRWPRSWTIVALSYAPRGTRCIGVPDRLLRSPARRGPLALRDEVRDRPLGLLGGERHGLGERRVGVDGERHVLRVEARLDRQHGLGQQLARVDA